VLAFVRPCRPILAKRPPIGGAWLHEPKLDGYRLQVVKDGPDVRLYSRNGHDWTKRLARLVEDLTFLPCRSAILDAELCFPTPSGAPDFYGLSCAIGAGRQQELAIFAFDLLHRDGADLRPLRLIDRQG
jgi:ATP-dependent DNA ligase